MTKQFTGLQEIGFAPVTYDSALRQDVAEALEAWRGFVQLPDGEKDRFSASPATQSLGYERKQGVGHRADKKENFDVTVGYTVSDKGDSDSVRFIERAVSLARRMSALAVQTSHEIGEEYAIESLSRLRPDQLETFVRFLSYPGDRDEGEMLGEPHVDQSGMTFHLAETTEGCEYLHRGDRTWKPLEVSGDHGVVFGAMQLQLMSHGEIRALTHRIVPNETSRQYGRLAIVCFIRFVDGTPVYDKEAHGRLQEFDPGFQYDMSPEDFASLFRS